MWTSGFSAFQHAAARRRLANSYDVDVRILRVSTRSRPKAAGIAKTDSLPSSLFQHAAARRRLDDVDVAVIAQIKVSTRSRPKAAGLYYCYIEYSKVVSTRSRPKAAGLVPWLHRSQPSGFNTQPPEGGWGQLRLHSHCSSKFQHAAARRRLVLDVGASNYVTMFQHAAARRRLVYATGLSFFNFKFQHAAARRRLGE